MNDSQKTEERVESAKPVSLFMVFDVESNETPRSLQAALRLSEGLGGW